MGGYTQMGGKHFKDFPHGFLEIGLILGQLGDILPFLPSSAI